MSQAIFAQPLPTVAEGVEMNPALGGRRKSLNPVAMADNYKRRLSLAVPQAVHSRRGLSMGNVLKGIDSPAAKRLRFKRWHTSESSESLKEQPNTPSPTILRNPRRVAFLPGSPSTPSMGSEALDIIAEHSEEGVNSNGKDNKTTDTDKPHPRLKKQDRLSGSGSLKLKKTAFSDVLNEVAPSSGKRPLSYTASSASCPGREGSASSLRRSLSTGSSKSGRSLPGKKSPDRNIRYVPGRDSPSISHRRKLQRSNTTSAGETAGETQEPEEKDKNDRVGSLRNNVSYVKALSDEGMD